jgi:hypothetical protein
MRAEYHSETYEYGVRRQIGRRDFLKISATGIVGAVTLGALGNSTAFAQQEAPDSALRKEFEEAAEEFGVPVGILIAMGYVNTRWEMPPPDASEYEEGELHGWGGYGIMALVQNPSTDTLGEASKLTGIPEEELKTDRRSNILGGAALLAESQKAQGRSVLGRGEKKAREQGNLSPKEAGGWLDSVSGQGAFRTLGVKGNAPAPAGVGGGQVYKEQVSQALKSGDSGRAETEEQIGLQAQEMADEGSNRAEVS